MWSAKLIPRWIMVSLILAVRFAVPATALAQGHSPPPTTFCRDCCPQGQVEERKNGKKTGECIEDPCKGKPELMHWPTNNRCVPGDCDDKGGLLDIVRDREGNCARCEKRNREGNCALHEERKDPSYDWSTDPVVQDVLKDYKFANDVWAGYHPEKGYGLTDITFSPSGEVIGCTNKPETGVECSPFPDTPNPVSPKSTSSVKCTYNSKNEWECVETSK